MSEPRDFERRLRTWLDEEGPGEVPNRVVDAAIQEAVSSPRQRPLPGFVHALLSSAEALVVATRAPMPRAWIAAVLLLALIGGSVVVGGMIILQLERVRSIGAIAFDAGGDIWVVGGRSGDEPVQMTRTIEREESNPVWSPDGRRLAYWVTDVDRSEVHILDAERGSVRVFEDPAGFVLPLRDQIFGWSPNGRSIAVPVLGTSTGAGRTLAGIEGVVIIDVETGDAKPVPVDGSAWSFGWSPNGRYLGVVVDGDLLVYDLTDGTFRSRYRERVDGPTGAGRWMSELPPVFSKDGRSILFTRGDYGSSGDIWSLAIDSEADDPVVVSDSNELAPMPSRDGRRLAFARSRALTLEGALAYKGIGQGSQIMVTSTSGGEATIVVEDVWPVAVWSPDGRQLATKSFDDAELVIVDVERPDELFRIPVPEGSSVGSFSWGPMPP